MKRYFTFALALCFCMALSAQNLFVGTYNIRNHNSSDDSKGNVWTKRCQVICDQLNFEDPDIFGTQEVLVGQLHDLLKGLDGYGYVGVGRDDGKEDGEYSAIFYKKDRLELLQKGNFWLNETPDKPVLGWDAACVRICSWGEFRQKKTGFRFYYFNLHMDHIGIGFQGDEVRVQQDGPQQHGHLRVAAELFGRGVGQEDRQEVIGRVCDEVEEIVQISALVDPAEEG